MLFRATKIASCLRFGGTVGEQQSLIRDTAQPKLLLRWSSTDEDRITAEKRSQHSGRDTQIDARHLFADAIHIKGTAAEAAILFGNKKQLNANSLGIAHCVDDVHRAFITGIQINQFLVRQVVSWQNLEGTLSLVSVSFSYIMARLYLTFTASRILLVNSGRNSRMSSTIPTSAT